MGQQRPSVSLCRHCNPYIELGAYTRFLIAVELKNAFKVVGKEQKTQHNSAGFCVRIQYFHISMGW